MSLVEVATVLKTYSRRSSQYLDPWLIQSVFAYIDGACELGDVDYTTAYTWFWYTPSLYIFLDDDGWWHMCTQVVYSDDEPHFDFGGHLYWVSDILFGQCVDVMAEPFRSE